MKPSSGMGYAAARGNNKGFFFGLGWSYVVSMRRGGLSRFSEWFVRTNKEFIDQKKHQHARRSTTAAAVCCDLQQYNEG